MGQSMKKRLQGREEEGKALSALWGNQFTVAEKMEVMWSPAFVKWLREVTNAKTNHLQHIPNLSLEPEDGEGIHDDPFSRMANAIAGKISSMETKHYREAEMLKARIEILEQQLIFYQKRDDKAILPGAQTLMKVCRS